MSPDEYARPIRQDGVSGQPASNVRQSSAALRKAALESVAAGLTILAITTVSIWNIWHTSERLAYRAVCNDLSTLACLVAAAVDTEIHDQIRDREMTNGPMYTTAVEPLRRALHAAPRVRYIYTAVLVEGSVRFVLDAAEPGDHDGDGREDQAYVGEEYDDCENAIFAAFGANGAEPVPTASPAPYSDQWGTFITGYAPVRRPDGTVAGVVGVDLLADQFLADRAARRRSAVFGLVPAGILSLIAGSIVYRLRVRHYAAVWQVVLERQRADQLADVVRRTANAIIVGGKDGRIEWVNAAFTNLFGLQPSEAIGRNLVECLTECAIDGRVSDRIAEALSRVMICVSNGGAETVEVSCRGQESADLRLLLQLESLRTVDDTTAGFVAMTVDVTAQRSLETQLRIGESRMRAIIEAVADGIVMHDVHGAIVACNPAAERILGLSRGQLIGRTGADFDWRTGGPADETPAADSFPPLISLRTGQPVRDLVVGLNRDDGRRVWLRVNCELIRDDTGVITAAVASFSDITEDREVRCRLADERSRLAAFVEHAPAAIAMFDREMRYIAVSRRWLHEYRLGDRTIIGLSHYEVFPDIPSRWREVHQVCLAGDVRRCDEDAWRPPGWQSDQYLRWEVRPWYQPDGVVGGILMLTQDITEQRERERELSSLRDLAQQAVEDVRLERDRLELALEGGGLGSWDWNVQTGTVQFDQRWMTMLGERPESLVQPLDHWVKRVHPDDLPRAQHAIRDHFEGRTAVYECVHRVRHADGRWRWIMDRGRVTARDSLGRPTRVVGTHQDVTAQKEHEQALAAARNAAESANRAKSEFLANMSHEIRTPLTAILGFADLLLEDSEMTAGPARRLQTVETIRLAGNHLLSIINDILDLSKIEAGRMTLEAIPTDLPRLLEEVEAMSRPRAESRGLGLTTRLLTAVPRVIRTDPTRLRQVLMNVIGNACKFTEVGGISVDVSTRSVGEDEWLRIDVTDSGLGMTPQQAHCLFQPFTQADGTMARRFGGTGLGLVISRHLTTMLGGNVTLVRSVPSEGSTFRIEVALCRLPGTELVERLELNPFPAIARQASNSASSPRLSGRILLAEDGPDNQRLIAFHLRKAGAMVEVAGNGQVALDMLKAAKQRGVPYDLLVSDMQMPVIDGYTLAGILRSEGWSIPVIALTAHAMAEDRQRCIDAGCHDYATKPIDKFALLDTCAHWLTKVRPRHAA